MAKIRTLLSLIVFLLNSHLSFSQEEKKTFAKHFYEIRLGKYFSYISNFQQFHTSENIPTHPMKDKLAENEPSKVPQKNERV